MPMHTRSCLQSLRRGTTLLELAVSTTVLASVLVIVAGLAQSAQSYQRDVSSNGAANSRITFLLDRIQRDLCYASVDSLLMGPLQDVTPKAREEYVGYPAGAVPAAAAIAGGYLLDSGTSMTPVDYHHVSFLHAYGVVGAQVVSLPRRSFYWEPTEAVDGTDNDGNGLVDEGRVRLGFRDTRTSSDEVVTLLHDVTSFRVYRVMRDANGRPYPESRVVVEVTAAGGAIQGRGRHLFTQKLAIVMRGE